MEWLNEYHLGGIAIGICTFLIIGLFHPIVVKAEYYWGNALLVDFPDFRNSRYHRLNLNQRHTHFFTDRRFLFFVILDYKRNF